MCDSYPVWRISVVALLSYYALFLTLFSAVNCRHEDSGVKLPSRCETCKYVVTELADRFGETGKTRDLIEPTVGVKKKYRDSELRFVETMEDLCDRILSYNMHKEHKNSKRFAKGMSQTMKTLHGLADKGVKVDLGIPKELWDSPSVEVSRMKQYCEDIVSQFEDDLEGWYRGPMRPEGPEEIRDSLKKFLCEERVLAADDMGCFSEETQEGGSSEEKQEGSSEERSEEKQEEGRSEERRERSKGDRREL